MSFHFPAFRRRCWAIIVSISLAATGLLVVSAAPADAASRAFTPAFTANATGDIIIRGNALLTCLPGSVVNGGTTTCAATQAGGGQQNNNYFMSYIDADGVTGGNTTFNSSSATVTVPAGATVLYAGLSWGATTAAGALANVPALTGVAAPNAAARNKAKFKVPGATGYTEVTSTTTDVTGSPYQAFLDVTPAVKAAGSGSYTVADVQAGTGGGGYAGWSLAVAYSDPTLPSRNLVIFTGYETVSSNTGPVDIPVSGFTTPLTGPVTTKVGVVAYEGDKSSGGDSMSIGSTSLYNGLNPISDVFNASLTDLNVPVADRSPNYANQLGFDIDRFDATGALATGSTSTVIHLTTSGDTYYPGMMTFVTDLYSSALTATKTVTDVNGGSVSRGDQLNYSVTVRNTGGDGAIATTLSDALPASTTYVPGSLTLGGTLVTDATGDDTGEVTGGNVSARLGTGATSSAGGVLLPGATATVAFAVTVNASVTDGTAVVNTALFSNRDQTTGVGYSGGSNTVTSTVVVPPTLSGTLAPGTLTAPYSSGLTVNAGTGPFVWSVSAGTLPAGLTLNTSTGLITGTPTATGSFSVTIRVIDANSRIATRTQSIVISKATSTISLSAPASVQFGTPLILTAAVGPSSPTGTVTFTDVPVTGPQAGTTITLGTGTVSGGTASLTTTLPVFGVNTVTASYSGDATYTSAVSATRQVEVSAYAGEVIVTEFRTSGPGGAGDNYVELLNTGPPVPLAGIKVSADSGTVSTLPANAGILGTGRSYLLTGAGFTLAAIATSDYSVATVGTGGMKVTAPDTASTTTDAAGPATGFHTGAGMPAITGNPDSQWARVRTERAGKAVDSRDNAADFQLVSTGFAAVGGVLPTLGSASPTGTADPYQRNAVLTSALVDSGAAAAVAPNRVVVPGPPRTLEIRRTITNTTGQPVTTAKVRITEISERNGAARSGASQPARVAQLRAVNPAAATTNVRLASGAIVPVRNLSVDAPSTAGLGGGLNSTFTVPLPVGGLAPGASIDIGLTFEVDTSGTFWLGYDVDATIAGGSGAPGARLADRTLSASSADTAGRRSDSPQARRTTARHTVASATGQLR